MGHMTVRLSVHAFVAPGFHLWSQIGHSHATLGKRAIATVIARTETDFRHGARAGDLLVVQSAFTRLGSKSLTMSQRMTNAETGVLCATQEAVEVFFDLKTRSAIPIPDDIRAKLEPVLAKAG